MVLASDNNLEFNIQQTATEIAELWVSLLGSAKTNFFDELPVDLFQGNHLMSIGQEVFSVLPQNTGILVSLQLELRNDLFSLFNMFSKKIQYVKLPNDASKIEYVFHTSEDNRFKASDWSEIVYYEFIKDIYLLFSNFTYNLIDSLEGLTDKTRDQLHMYLRNFLDAVSPSNSLFLNPELIRATFESRGFNLFLGTKNFLQDLVDNKGNLSIKMTDTSKFAVGKNIAVTEGVVLFQNEMLQLIQYLPTTDKVKPQPILFVPPWINKYYILDLNPDKSMVKWLTDRGFCVFMISWVNPKANNCNMSMDDYLTKGTMAAIDTITKDLGFKNLHAVGYCIGGTLLGATLAYMSEKKDNRVTSATYFTTLMDFSNPGELGVFIDELQLGALEGLMNEKGYLDGRFLDAAFNMLRPNDLLWPFYINNYLLGKDPKPFDLLYWNSDSTNLPGKMYNFYLKNMYLKNNLCKPGGITLDGVAIDLKKIKVPVYFVGAESDHITPWKATYLGVKLHSGKVVYVLSGSGHIAGIVNPPHKNKYYYRTNEQSPADADKWLKGSKKVNGSWWGHWEKWLNSNTAGELIDAPNPRSCKLPVIEQAPGSYVMEKI